MKLTNKTVRRYAAIGAFMLTALGASFYVVPHKNPEAYNVKRQARAGLNINTSRPKAIVYGGGEASYPSDFSDDRKLVGVSHYIFVGKVVGEVKTEGWYTQFAVQVVDNIKGNLRGTINVGVTGGYRDGVFYVAKGSTWLTPGSAYLLAVRYRSIDGSYRLVDFDDPVSWKLLSENSALTTAQLQTIAGNDARVQQLQAAYPNEILDRADVYNHNDFNNYKSTHVPPPPPPAPAPTSTELVASPLPLSLPISTSSEDLSASSTASSTIP